jgi:hypothetical protein
MQQNRYKNNFFAKFSVGYSINAKKVNIALLFGEMLGFR